jgi:large subunit ribosomal protein L3
MNEGLVGKKIGMTRVFNDSGSAVPVTVISVDPNYISRVITRESDGYAAIQVTTGTRRASRVNKALKGQYKKANIEAGRGLWEFRLTEGQEAKYSVGDAIDASLFEKGQKVDVSAKSKGKGFAGVIKRHNFSMQDATHGNSLSHRAPGSIGQNQTPGRVFKGKKMAGQLGNKNCTVQNLEIVEVNKDKNYILVMGGVPGAPGVDVIIRPTVKVKSSDMTTA